MEETDPSLAESRPRRARAGRNIGKLIDQEQDGDDFYKSAYGGFEEESADEEYEEEASEDDVVDSDFDVDESAWNQEEDGEKQLQLMEQQKKKKQWLKPTKPKQPAPDVSEPTLKPPKAKKPRTTALPTPMDTATSEQRSLRKSTLEVSEEFRRRMQEEEEIRQIQRSRKSAARKKPQRRLTQKEMFEEAEKTERENLASLEAYIRLTAEKRKVKTKKTGIHGPFMRFHSVTMPAITELPDQVSDAKQDGQSNQGTTINSSNAGGTLDTFSATQNQSSAGEQLSTHPHKSTEQAESQQRYCRNFLIFTDTVNYPSAFFPTTKPQKPRKKFCPVTGLPARYVDPVTGTPYATSQAFRVIRNKYISEGEQKCEKRLLQLSSWLEEKKRKKMEAKAY